MRVRCRWRTQALLLVLLGGGESVGRAAAAAAEAEALTDLRAWLHAVHVYLPKQSIALLGDTATMSRIDCHSFSLGSLDARLSPQGQALHVSAGGMEAWCSMDWTASQATGILRESGTVALRVVRPSSLRVELHLQGNNSASFSGCHTAVHFGQLRWAGFAGQLLNRLNVTLESSIAALIDLSLCTLLRRDLAANITAAMRAADGVLAPLLSLGQRPPPPAPPLPPLPEGHRWYDLGSSVWLGMLDYVLDTLVGVDVSAPVCVLCFVTANRAAPGCCVCCCCVCCVCCVCCCCCCCRRRRRRRCCCCATAGVNLTLGAGCC
jgi:hypothetical protein